MAKLGKYQTKNQKICDITKLPCKCEFSWGNGTCQMCIMCQLNKKNIATRKNNIESAKEFFENFKEIYPNGDLKKYTYIEIINLLVKYGNYVKNISIFGKKTKTKKLKNDCFDCKYNFNSNFNACIACPEEIGFGYHYK